MGISSLRFSRPMLASNNRSIIPNNILDKSWVFERKYDGVRCIIVKNGDRISLLSRKRINYTPYFPEIVNGLKNQKGSFVIDGEIVSDSFYDLHKKLSRKKGEKVIEKKVRIMLFDMLNENGVSLKDLPYLDRKMRLRNTISFGKTICYVKHKQGVKEKLIQESKMRKWEGIIAKKIDAPYVNKRSKDVVKYVNFLKRKFYVCGYKTEKGNKRKIGSLVLGSPGNFRKYSGKVRFSATQKVNNSVRSIFSSSLRKIPTLKLPRRMIENVYWLRPKWKVEVAFLEYTKKRRLRLPRLISSAKDQLPLLRSK